MFNNNFYKIMQSFAENKTSNSAPTARLTKIDGTSNYNSSLISGYGYYNALGFVINAIAQNSVAFPTLYILNNGTNIYYGSNGSHAISDWNGSEGGVWLGDGDTPPTLTDYNLSGNKITTFSATTSASATYEDGKLVFVGTYNITNTGADTIVIKEAGLFVGLDYGPYMVERSVLPTPLSIAPSAMKTLVYKIKFNA